MITSKKIAWPNGKDFAFTIFDDTDLATVENVGETYAFLADCGFRTTKSVWPICGRIKPKNGGATCEDAKDYLDWVLSLQKKGFEIGYHNATFNSSLREDTIRGIEKFARLFGGYPRSMANHADCRENIYWSHYRVTGINELIFNLLTRYKNHNYYRGHVEGDPFFWGDICKEKIQYVRNFVFGDINTLKIVPFMPYHDPKRPLVNYWFASSEGAKINSFNQRIAEKNQDRLEEEGGCCIMYTHFSDSVYQDDHVNSRFKMLMKRLSQKNGWFAPVSDILDHLLKVNGHHNITDGERRCIERKWLLHKIITGGTT